SGRPLAEAIAHGREAVALLALTDDEFWLSQALFTLSYCCIFAGDFDASLEAATQLGEFGDSTGLRRAQANAGMLAGLAYAMKGEGQRAVELCAQARQISPDDFETAFILACLGRAHQASADLARAVSSLEKAVALADRVRSIQFRAWFRTMLGEAYLLNGQIEQAQAILREALNISVKVGFMIGVGLSRFLLGRVALANGIQDEAQTAFKDAIGHLDAVGARFELERAKSELSKIAHVAG